MAEPDRAASGVQPSHHFNTQMNFDKIPWSIAEGIDEGMPVITRFRNFDQSFPRSRYPKRLNIFWKFSNPKDNGLPSPEDSVQAEAFEDRLVEAVENDNHSILSMVLTGKGQREYVFHTSNANEFLQRLTAMPQEQDRYPIEINSFEDVDWNYDGSVLGDISSGAVLAPRQRRRDGT